MIAEWLSTVWARVRAQFADARNDAELREELADHLLALEEEYRRRGLPPDEARRQARLRLGGVTRIEESARERRRLPWLDTLDRDLRYAVRVLRRSPAFTIAAVASLGLGIGCATAMFGLVRSVLLRPLPYDEPSRLVRVYETNPLKGWVANSASPANYADWRRRNTVFAELGAYEVFDTAKGSNDLFLSGFGEPQRLRAVGVTGNLLRLLGTAPILGRTFTDEETFDGHGRSVVLSFGLWQSLFNGDAGVIGRQIALSGRTYDIVGVMPRTFFFPRRDVQVWYPVAYAPKMFAEARRPHWLTVIGRLAPGVSLRQASDQMTGIAARLEQEYPDTNTKMGVRLEPYQASLVGDAATPLYLLLGAVALLFVIVCVNLGGLQVGRVAERGREMAIRQALGAGRGRLLWQLAVEGLVISVLGSVIAAMVATAIRAAALRFGPQTLGIYSDLHFDWTVVLFGTALVFIAPVLFGVAPALTTVGRQTLNDRTGGTAHARGLRDALVTIEVGLSIVLVIGAGLFLRSLERLQRVDPGFVSERVLTFGIDLPSSRYPDRPSRLAAIDRIEAELRSIPKVNAVGATTTLVLQGFTWTGDATVEGRGGDDFERELRHQSVTPGYFASVGLRLVRGRTFTAADAGTTSPVVVVNEALARQYFRTDDVVGRRLTFGRPQDRAPWVTIVGVVADAKQDGLAAPVRPAAYDPFGQRPQASLVFAVRTAADPAAAAGMARTAVARIDPRLVLTDVRTLDEVVRSSTAAERFRTWLVSGFAGAALLLAALGIYGVLTYFVTQRSREIGIRLALGAAPGSVFWMVVRQAVRPVLPGAAIGLAVAYASTDLLRSVLFGVERLDVPTYAGTAALLVAAAAVATCVPAFRAVRVDPNVAIREL